jgi:hypothetical protein
MRRVRHDQLAGLLSHFGDAQGAGEPADVAHVGLDDIDSVHADHPPPLRQVVVLLAAGDKHVQRRGDFGRPFQFPIRARFLEEVIPVVLHAPADLDRLGRRVATVAVRQQADLVSHGSTDGGNQPLRPARRRIAVVSGWHATRTLNARKPNSSRKRTSRAASSSGEMSRLMLEP